MKNSFLRMNFCLRMIEELQMTQQKSQQNILHLTEEKTQLEKTLAALKEKTEQAQKDLEQSNIELKNEQSKQEELSLKLDEKEKSIKENEVSLDKFKSEIDELNEKINGEKKNFLVKESELDASVSFKSKRFFVILVSTLDKFIQTKIKLYERKNEINKVLLEDSVRLRKFF